MIKAVSVGKLSLVCEIFSKETKEGIVYFVIDGQKFGNLEDEFELDAFFLNASHFIESFKPFYPRLFELNDIDLLESIDIIRNDEPVTNCLIDRIEPGFYDDPTDILDDIIFYGGNYAFDNFTIIFVTNGVEGRLVIRNENTKIYRSVVISVDSISTAFDELFKSIQ